MHDMTCLEVRRQPANCCAKDLLFMTIYKVFVVVVVLFIKALCSLFKE